MERNIWAAILIFHVASITLVALIEAGDLLQWWQCLGWVVLSGWAIAWLWRGRKPAMSERTEA
jgi:hypothetical protein